MSNILEYARELIAEKTQGRKLTKAQKKKIYKDAWAEAKRNC